MSGVAQDSRQAAGIDSVVCSQCGQQLGANRRCPSCAAHAAEATSEPPSVFINYRRVDAAAHSKLLHEHLAARFGDENVFLDVDALKPGMDWRRTINARANACGVLLAVIGPQWLSILLASVRRGVLEAVDDVARRELELALTHRGDVEVIPVLVDGATMPPARELPQSLQALCDRQAEELRLATYDEDVERLIRRLERIATGERAVPTPQREQAEPRQPASADPAPVMHGKQHHERAATLMSGAGHVVVVLGSEVNRGSEDLPNAERLADALAKRFSYESDADHLRLVEVAEYVEAAWGKPDLYISLKENLAVEYEPTKVHRFLAGFPARLEALGCARRHLLIVTTNYDSALECAFAKAGEPFDLAVYVASAGRFLHRPWDARPALITEPNQYHEFPIDDQLALTRSVIVKIHGAVDGDEMEYAGEDAQVVTEDDYINYLSGTSVQEIIPFQILQKLRSSHCLFLGMNIRDWNLRVFLRRIWGARIRAASWAVQAEATEFEHVLWRQCGADVITEPLDEYVDALGSCLRRSR